MIVTCSDDLPPHFDPDYMFVDYEVWVVKNSGQTINFGEDLFVWSSSFDAQVNGESIFDMEAYIWTQYAIKGDYGDGDMAPGEAYYLGGISTALESAFLPNTSTAELSFLSVLFRNESGNSDTDFWVDYNGDPITNTLMIATPVPATGHALFLLFSSMSLLGRKRTPTGSLNA
ncbi:MAG: hypothetical protein AB8G18_17205 [Gammaproteobacteria bacterium]